MKPLTPAKITWHRNQPRSSDYNDIYSSDDSIKESQRVFTGPGQLIERAQKDQCVCIGELGFGTGLNFAVSAETILHKTQAKLRFIAFEKHPLSIEDWQKVVSTRVRQLPVYAELLTQPLPVLTGWHERTLANGRITLTVYHGDVHDGLEDLCDRQRNPVNMWFLDGFTPTKNPDMWTCELYRNMARLSDFGTTVTTFTAAGHVRRGLQNVGFTMRRVDQTGAKRHSLAGFYSLEHDRAASTPPKRVHIHGAGIGGATVARHLAEAGVTVEVYDPNGIAGGASGIPASVVHSRLMADQSLTADLRCSAFHYASNYLPRFKGWNPGGVLQLQGPTLSPQKMNQISALYGAKNPDQAPWIQHLSAEQSREIANASIHQETLLFPSAGYLNTPQACSDLLEHPAIHVHNHQAGRLADAPNVLCTATATRQFGGCQHLEITDVFGQIDHYRTPDPISGIAVVGNGYLIPTPNGCFVGASYERTAWTQSEAIVHNLRLNQHLLTPAQMTWIRSTRGARATTSDRNPIVGRLNPEKSPVDDDAGPAVWLATAFGSIGCSLAPLAAACVSAEILGWLPPINTQIYKILQPQRFAERQARRGYRHIAAPNAD